jgi:hypothetical protein
MGKQTVAVITTLGLLAYFIVTLSPVSANQMVVDVFIRNQLPIPVSSITITHFVPVDIYAQVGYIESGTFPPSDFQWYVNGEPTKFESAGNSVYRFTPQAIGKYVITVTVNGEINSDLITVTVIPEQSSFNFVTPWVWETPPNLTVESPTNGTYTERVLLNFTVEAPTNWFNNQSGNWNEFNLYNTAIEQRLKSISYFLDGNLTTITVDSNLGLPYKGSVELTNLTEGTHQLTVFTNATGVYRSFRGFFAETQINDFNKTVIDFNFIPSPASSPINPSVNQTVEPLNMGIVVLLVLVVIGCLLLYRRHRKTANSVKKL